MTIFGKSARDTFLMAALAQAGITEETVATAQAANNLDFLGNAGAALSTVQAEAASLRTELANVNATVATVRSAFGLEALTTDALNAAVAAKVEAARKQGEEAGSRAAAAELAARGHAPVPTAPAAASATGNSLAEQYQGITNARERAAFIRTHGLGTILASIRRGALANN